MSETSRTTEVVELRHARVAGTASKACMSAASLGIVLLLTACTTAGGGRSATQGREASGALVSPLAVQVTAPARLGNVNSLLVASPRMTLGASRAGLSIEQFHGLVEETARRELGLNILGQNWLSKNQGVANLNLYGLGQSQRGSIATLGVDSVLTTELLQYDDRVGSAVGGEPATVAFTMSITGLSDGAEIWRGTYFFRQQQLTENLLALGDRLGTSGSGPALNSGREELERGLTAAVSDFGARREKVFMVVKSGK